MVYLSEHYDCSLILMILLMHLCRDVEMLCRLIFTDCLKWLSLMLRPHYHVNLCSFLCVSVVKEAI
jgi:hypothetical protein